MNAHKTYAHHMQSHSVILNANGNNRPLSIEYFLSHSHSHAQRTKRVCVSNAHANKFLDTDEISFFFYLHTFQSNMLASAQMEADIPWAIADGADKLAGFTALAVRPDDGKLYSLVLCKYVYKNHW